MGVKKDTPFHSAANRRHHARSERNDLFSRIGCGHSGCIGTPFRRSNIRRKNVRPQRTTLHAWFRTPMRDSRSRRRHAFLSPHSWRRELRRSNLSAGSLSWPATVSTSMPRKVRHVVGPSRLCSAMGTPSRAHALSSCASGAGGCVVAPVLLSDEGSSGHYGGLHSLSRRGCTGSGRNCTDQH